MFMQSESEKASEAFATAIIAELEALPQFIRTNKGLLNALNGCFVSIGSDWGIELNWNDGHATPTYTNIFSLGRPDKIDKFMVLMRAQAAQLLA